MTFQTGKMKSNYRDVKVPNVTDDTVWFIYRGNDNYRRFNYFTWVKVPDSPYAGFEISVAGRIVDQDGLEHLIAGIRDGVRMVK